MDRTERQKLLDRETKRVREVFGPDSAHGTFTRVDTHRCEALINIDYGEGVVTCFGFIREQDGTWYMMSGGGYLCLRDGAAFLAVLDEAWAEGE